MEEIYVPHAGWLTFEKGDLVAQNLAEGWFASMEQALCWLYLDGGSTLVDCGAHAGLFTLVAARAMANHGTIVAVEPVAATAQLLSRNVESNGLSGVRVVQAAVTSRSAPVTVYAGKVGMSAYSCLYDSHEGGPSGASDCLSSQSETVRGMTLDEVIGEAKLERIDLVKLTVEGCEVGALQGLRGALQRGRIPLIMVGFDESRLARAGYCTKDLFDAIRGYGLEVCRFNGQRRCLEPATYEGPIASQNLFATPDAAAINRRLSQAGGERQRIAADVARRGMAAWANRDGRTKGWERCHQAIERLRRNAELLAVSVEQRIAAETRAAMAEEERRAAREASRDADRQRREAERQYLKNCERATRAEERVEELEQQLARVRELTIGPDTPPEMRFGGWKSMTGLTEVEGPYPHVDLPWVRWGLQSTRLVFETDSEDRLALVLDVLSPVSDQEVTIHLDGAPIARIPLPEAGRFEVVAIPFRVPRGMHTIEMSYRHLHDHNGTNVGGLFRSLCVLPDYSRATELLYQQRRGIAAVQSAKDRPAPPAPPPPLRSWRSLARRGLSKIKRILLRRPPGQAA